MNVTRVHSLSNGNRVVAVDRIKDGDVDYWDEETIREITKY